jgi:hypothetical protein
MPTVIEHIVLCLSWSLKIYLFRNWVKLWDRDPTRRPFESQRSFVLVCSMLVFVHCVSLTRSGHLKQYLSYALDLTALDGLSSLLERYSEWPLGCSMEKLLCVFILEDAT